ncbi:facilitated trehalose transporter Tret1-like [Adelges cooleyi]|uniref:facilitated trehalose transporter Tret1-like n=1 Tax=Adelges cooleyi TaxID=133065 RepID=UPI00217FC0B1|nr:facilitated trehalose transporter Tret1-like [Adelges cooleyi]
MNHDGMENANNVRSTFAQCFAISGACFVQAGFGAEWISPTIIIGALINSTKHVQQESMVITSDQASWLGSLLYLSTPLGSMMSSVTLTRLGHKKCMILTNIPFIIALLMFYYSKNIETLYACSVLMGLSMGYAGGPCTAYITEVCEPKLRGALTSVQNVFFYFGSLFPSTLYAYTKDWRLTMIITSIIPIITIAILLMTPDSPIWLLTRDKSEKAHHMLSKLRGWVPNEKCVNEFHEMVVYTTVETSDKMKPTSIWKLLLQPNVLRPFRLLIFYFLFTNILSGAQYTPYLVEVFTKFGVQNVEWTITIYVALSTTGGILTIFAVNRCGKRMMTLSTLLVGSVCYTAIGFIGTSNPTLEPAKSWTILVLFLVTIFVSSFGMSPLAWVILGEIFPIQTRNITCSICSSLSYIISFVLIKFYPDLEDLVGFYNGFLVFGTMGLFGCVYFYLYLPETENKTLQEIEECFK